MLVYPTRAVAGWLIGWGIVTALCRPLSGEPFAEFIERAGNFGAPLALLLISGGVRLNLKSWFILIDPDIQPDARVLKNAVACLKAVVFLLLAGHGWLNLTEKESLIRQYTSLGFNNPATTAHIIGALEVAAALAVLVRPVRSVVLAFFVWKVISELFYPHYEIFEWIERGGSYGCILALWFVLNKDGVRQALNSNLQMG